MGLFIFEHMIEAIKAITILYENDAMKDLMI